ncbi:DsbA family oxidoreductase [Clostridium grantii]|uniref:Predicted dithiol-disulfide isomerase, DsbA family n=1 Tax=Clostridium grantii DSM 8605 TaxID=1121316 RepID=A0A1M5WNZ4_9CLOT|nr:DsbA family oxidoreductase [Clostridium grantii]SHH89237.1 Predicted dithiol-disulfide isomerase, DsbA family [Clostridium grantii DSM 8605]
MKVEIWSDYACPFCYIGERKLELALKETGMMENTEIVFKSFELNPDAKKRYDKNINELIAEKYGVSLEQAAANNKNIISAAKELGLDYNFEDLKYTNTFDAHRLSHYAKAEGKLKEYTEAVMKSYFIDSELISDAEVLVSIAEKVGLDKERALIILNTTDFSHEVRQDEQSAYERGVNGVPYFVFDEKQAVYGVQPVDAFVKIIESLK